MNVVIVAGGLATRFKRLSCIPKLLLPTTKDDSILTHDCKLFKNDNIFVIINNKFEKMLSNYIAVNHLDNITVLTTDNHNGSYNTIKSVIDRIDVDNALFIWSDLILQNTFQEFDTELTTIFTKHGEYRYFAEYSDIRQVRSNGNVPGIYYISDIKSVFSTKLNAIDNYDLIDAIDDADVNFTTVELDNELAEYRDLETYCDKLHTELTIQHSKTRFFNELKEDSTDSSKLIKTALLPEYHHLIKKEHDWYVAVDKLHLAHHIIPSVESDMRSDNSFAMTNLKNYETLHFFRQHASIKVVEQVYSFIFDYLNELSMQTLLIPKEGFADDLRLELVTKVINRCDSVKDMLVNYNKEDLTNKLTQVYEYFMSKQSSFVNYNVCHGDLNGSNIMVDPITLDVKFIDPRGYFGCTEFYGWQQYEYAKLLYSLMGYDEFNTNNKIYTEEVPKLERVLLESNFIYDKLYTKDNLMLVGVIYIALASYISQDISKSNIAYEYGMSLLTGVLHDKKTSTN